MVENPLLSEKQTWERTIDLADIARINRGERVEVEHVEDKTQGLFSKTINLLHLGDARGARPVRDTSTTDEERYIPNNEALRKVYLFAEALGGYEALNDLSSKYSPGQRLSRRYGKKTQTAALKPQGVKIVEDYQRQLDGALKSANRYLLANQLEDFSHDELYEILKAAKYRSQELSEILGAHLIHEIENSVTFLHELREKIRAVEKSVTGIFLVDSEVMFIPTYELIVSV